MDATSYLLGKKQGGGSPTPSEKIDTLGKLNEKANEFVNYLLQIPKSYEASTTENTTLYTPNSDYKTYIIVKISTGSKYRVYWFLTGAGCNYIDTSHTLYNYNITSDRNNSQPIALWENSLTNANSNFASLYYYEATTLDKCVQAIKSSTTTYTSSTNKNIIVYENASDDIFYSNTFIINKETGDYITTQKISSNETIEVIS